MRLSKARIQKYRSIRDTGYFDIEPAKTIFVGQNESGKTAIFQALQQLNPPDGVAPFNELRDYPRSEYNDVTTKKVDPKDISVVEGFFSLDDADKEDIPESFHNCIYVLEKRYGGGSYHRLENAPAPKKYVDLKRDLSRISAFVDSNIPEGTIKPSVELSAITEKWNDNTIISTQKAIKLKEWLDKIIIYINEDNEVVEKLHKNLINICELEKTREDVLKELHTRIPTFVLYSNYFRVKPIIHLEHLAQRIQTKILDDSSYDYGNICLLKLLGFDAKELSELGKASASNTKEFEGYREKLDKRSYQLNAASVKLTDEICRVWNPDKNKGEAARLRIVADGQYLKVVVEDDLGVEIELDQRSEGFQWIVSFFIVFFAEAADRYENAILLLDEPGLSLHGLKQREFRLTLSRLSEQNQTLYTTHSPFLVGPDELGLVRVVEMTDRKVGTKVHTTISSGASESLLPLQEALGYDLAQSLFSNQRNLILEGLTDYWYIEAISNLLRDAGIVSLNEKVALVPANAASRVVYFAIILHSHNLKVATLFDSDAAGAQAAKQDVLVHKLGQKNILQIKDFYTGEVSHPEIEDMLRETLIKAAKKILGWDVENTANQRPKESIVKIFNSEVSDFSKYRLARAFLKWSSQNKASDLTEDEKKQWNALISKINFALK